MLDRIRRYFEFEAHGTSFARETVAGLTTFVTMSYIIVVNPAILSQAGIPAGPSMVATVFTCIFGTLLMALYANRPFAIGPYMGENAFIAYTVVLALGFRWQAALGAVLIAGVLFVLLTLLRLRAWLVNAVPPILRYAFSVGIGLFLAFIGLVECGIVVPGGPGAPVRPGVLTSAPVLVSIFGIVLIMGLVMRRVPGAILLAIVVTALVAFACHVAPAPARWIAWPPGIGSVWGKADIRGALHWTFFPVILTIFIMAFVDTMGTLIGLSAHAGFLDRDGNLPQIERPMLVDALATTFAAVAGTTTAGAFVESATGIESGGRTGFTSLVTAGAFALALFFAPFATAVPPQAYGPALVVVGAFMLAPAAKLRYDDYTELFPAFAVLALMVFTYNIGIGITAGFVFYPLCKALAGRAREVHPGLWLLGALSLAFFVFYPYR